MMLVLRGLWFNGKWGQARRRIRLYLDGEQWLVEAQIGDNDGPTLQWTYACEPDARAWVADLIKEDGGGGWREVTSALESNR